MKYKKPVVLNIMAGVAARCQNGSNPTHDTCTSGTAGPGPGGTTCKTGYEADGANCAGGGGVVSGCTTGYAADNRCSAGNGVGANKRACSTGTKASTNACGAGTGG
jgi:hypothetical protein